MKVKIDGVGVVQFPDDMTPEQVTAAIENEILPKQKQRSIGEEALRQGGLGVRSAVQGLAGIAGIPANALGAAWNLTAGNLGASRMGTDLRGAVSGQLDRFLPKPETAAERIGGAGVEALVGAAPAVKAAQLAGPALQSLPLVRSIAGAPGADLTASAVGGLSEQAAREASAPEWAAMLIGAVAPNVVNAAVKVPGVVARGAREVVRPITKRGAEQIAADIIGKTTQDKTTALRNFDAHIAAQRAGTVGVPGSKPTAAAVAGDYGIAGAQQAISRGDANPLFAERLARNNAARLDDLATINATDAAIDTLKEKLDDITKPMRDAAFGAAQEAQRSGGGMASTVRVLDALDNIKRRHAGEDTQRAINWIRSRMDEFGGSGIAPPEKLYDLHKDINKLISGKVGDDRGPIRFAVGQAIQIKHAIAQSIDDVAPGFKKYLDHYSRLSRPIERLEILRDKLGSNLERVTNAMPSVTGDGARYSLSQAKMRNQIAAIESALNKEGLKLAPRQSGVLSRVLGDLNANEFAQRGGKMPGSDTYQNMASANFVNRIFGEGMAESGLGRGASKTLGVAYKPFNVESRINDILIDAYLDPAEMRRLLAMARTTRAKPTLAGMAEAQTPWVTGGLLGVLP